MSPTLRETIRELTNNHLNLGYMVAGQCLTAVGWVGGTLPERQDMTELPMSDVAGSGFAVGMALMGRRPIYVVRYQGFQWYNAAMVINYAAKSKAMWGRACPLLVRSIAMEGRIGPVAGSSHHSLFTRMPGVKVYAPMTPGEWRSAYAEFMAGDDVVYLSEHRGAYNNTEEMAPLSPPDHIASPTAVLFPISITRFAAAAVAMELPNVAVHHIACLKPFTPSPEALRDLACSWTGGIVIDDDYPSGVASDIAMQLHQLTGKSVRVLGLNDVTAGFASWNDNLPPNKDQIKNMVEQKIKGLP